MDIWGPCHGVMECWTMAMSDDDLRRYINQMLVELADLADERADDEGLGSMAFDLRLLAARNETREGRPAARMQ
jgi:hypothetical protein